MERNIRRDPYRFLPKTYLQLGETGEVSRTKDLIQREGEFRLTGVFMCQPQQIEYGPRGLPHRFGRNKCLPEPAVLRSGKDGIAIRQVGKGPGFGSQAMNHMVIVDDMAMLAVLVIRSPPAGQRLDPDVDSKQFQAIIVGARGFNS